jgi:hypothetical protein
VKGPYKEWRFRLTCGSIKLLLYEGGERGSLVPPALLTIADAIVPDGWPTVVLALVEFCYDTTLIFLEYEIVAMGRRSIPPGYALPVKINQSRCLLCLVQRSWSAMTSPQLLVCISFPNRAFCPCSGYFLPFFGKKNVDKVEDKQFHTNFDSMHNGSVSAIAGADLQGLCDSDDGIRITSPVSAHLSTSSSPPIGRLQPAMPTSSRGKALPTPSREGLLLICSSSSSFFHIPANIYDGSQLFDDP